MGDANLLSQELKEKVIYNFRANDIKNNGEGAPLTPIYHKLLINKFKINNPTLILNIGGISNYTYCFNDTLAAKDIGPGNVLMDEYLKKTKGIDYDKNGDIASSGNINKDIINQFYEHEFYNVQEKHSFDRKEFDFSFVKGLEFEDAVATLTYFTALVISQNIKKNFDNEIEIILCGGGRKNLTLINHLKKLLKYKIKLIDEFNIDGDFIESQAFAYLSIRSYLKFNSLISSKGTSSSFFPCIIRPEVGHGDKNEKSYTFGCGDIAINLLISGLLINNCIAINEPKENPDIQHCELSKFSLSNQSNAAAASASSP